MENSHFLWNIAVFILNDLSEHIIAVLTMLNQNELLQHLSSSDDEGGALICHSHEISQ